MTRYLLKFLFVTMVAICSYFGVILYLPSPIKAEYWVRELMVIKHHQAEAMPSPKIIVAGGSSTLFNVDAARMSRELQIPVVNEGLHAGLRLERVLYETIKISRRGDLVVLALEQPYYSCDREQWTDWQLRKALAWDRDYFDRMPFFERIKIVFDSGSPSLAFEILTTLVRVAINPSRMKERLDALAPDDEIVSRYISGNRRTRDFAYSAYNLDSHGTIEKNEGVHFTGVAKSPAQPNAICASQAQKLAQFIDEASKRGVKLALTYVPYLVEGQPADDWKTADDSFRQEIAPLHVPIIGTREDGFLDREKFFNSPLHLNVNGREIYTERLIKNLKASGLTH